MNGRVLALERKLEEQKTKLEDQEKDLDVEREARRTLRSVVSGLEARIVALETR